MENHILSLIKENNRVIVPNFGAFIVAKENGFSVLFNNFLSFNDGLLVDYIVDAEGIDKDEANRRIEEYVDKIKAILDEKGTYEIVGLGVFKKDTTGVLRFEQDEALTGETIDASIKQTKVESDDLLDIDNGSKSFSEPTVYVSTSDKNIAALNEESPIAEFEEEKIEPEADKTLKEPVVGSKPDPVEVAHKYIDEDNSKRNRSITIFLVCFLLIPIIGFGVYFFAFKGDSPRETNVKIAQEQTNITNDQRASDDQPMGDMDAGPDTVAQKPVEKVKEEPKEEVVVIKKPHRLIVGSFSSEKNANLMVNKLTKDGHKESFFFMHNDRYLVSIESFAKVYQAQARQEELLNSKRMESWIITKRN